MVTVQPVDGPSNDPGILGNAMGTVQATIYFIIKLWWLWILIFLIVFLVWYIYSIKKAEEEKRRLNDANYQYYVNLVADCKLNANLDKKKRQFLVLDKSNKIVDMNNNEIGRYRGETVTMNNERVFYLAKGKKFFFFDKYRFILRVPLRPKVKVKKQAFGDKFIQQHKDFIKGVETQKGSETAELQLDFTSYMHELASGDIKLIAQGIQKIDLYYRYPIFYIDGEALDLRGLVSSTLPSDVSLIQRMTDLRLSSEAFTLAMKHNPHVRAKQLMPEKQREIDDDIEL